ncbi:MAG TPA: hypothetical protein VI382_07070, partial [Candidatus Manganitrophaceae bacterium]|nr:hypothetical protein [Candidatus Manganitrophaceae bacterium]
MVFLPASIILRGCGSVVKFSSSIFASLLYRSPDAEVFPRSLAPFREIPLAGIGGGQRLYSSGVSEFTAAGRSTHHFIRIDVRPETLTLQATGV